jgi:nicotinate phosphoribosyltransferase
MNSKQPWEDCIKLSDDLGKHMGNPDEIEAAKFALHIE